MSTVTITIPAQDIEVAMPDVPDNVDVTEILRRLEAVEKVVTENATKLRDLASKEVAEIERKLTALGETEVVIAQADGKQLKELW